MKTKVLKALVFLSAALLTACSCGMDARADSQPVILCSGLPYADDDYYRLYPLETRNAVYLINLNREEAGLPPVQSADILEDAALIRAGEAAEMFSHSRPDGSPYYTAAPENIYGEILSAGHESAEDAVAAWMQSEVHRTCLLEPSYSRIGVMLHEHDGEIYWAVELGV